MSEKFGNRRDTDEMAEIIYPEDNEAQLVLKGCAATTDEFCLMLRCDPQGIKEDRHTSSANSDGMVNLKTSDNMVTGEWYCDHRVWSALHAEICLERQTDA
ncbi:hypothetical protein NLI96_g7394 [Meripilus lineatus]|uniref:Uncharacterized protein n=1 Tax=Meripilus lineatus TaxID=2056292 RepID=A0AAD5YHA8_9APHY|nr:hypothetical protein NLI96_g7394 [Physisporinus lineatus]